jgi:hypothetical protein
MDDVLPWAEYRRALTPLSDSQAFDLTDAEESPGFLASFFPGTMDSLGAHFYRDTTQDAYCLVQDGPDVPDCDRLLAYRKVKGTVLWDTSPEARRVLFQVGPLASFIESEAAQRSIQNRIFATEVPTFIYWEVNKLLGLRQLWTPGWGEVFAALRGLHERGLSNQEIHDLLFHTAAWAAHNDAAGMPRELIFRMHGLTPVLDAWSKQ